MRKLDIYDSQKIAHFYHKLFPNDGLKESNHSPEEAKSLGDLKSLIDSLNQRAK